MSRKRSVSIQLSCIESALDSPLDPRARERVIVLREFFLAGKSQGEIHRLTNHPIPHIKYWLHKARKGGVEAVIGKRGWRPDGRNRNYQLAESDENALIERLAKGTRESTVSIQQFLSELRPSHDLMPSAEAVRTYKRRLRNRAPSAIPVSKRTMETLVSSGDPNTWNLILRAMLSGCTSSRLKLKQEARRQGLPTKGWPAVWRAWAGKFPEFGNIVDLCQKMLGEAACEQILKDVQIARFNWIPNGSPIDGDHQFVWKVLGASTNRTRVHIAFVRQKSFPRGGVFYRSGHFVFRGKPRIRKIPQTELIERVIAAFRKNAIRRSNTWNTPSPHEEVVVLSSHSDELIQEMKRHAYVPCYQLTPESRDALRQALDLNPARLRSARTA